MENIINERTGYWASLFLLYIHEILNVFFLIVNFFRTVKGEKDEEDIQKTKKELTVHSIVSAVVFCLIIVFD